MKELDSYSGERNCLAEKITELTDELEKQKKIVEEMQRNAEITKENAYETVKKERIEIGNNAK